MYEELELTALNDFQDYIPEDSTDNIVIQSMLKQGAMQTIERVLDWSPAGVEGPNDED